MTSAVPICASALMSMTGDETLRTRWVYRLTAYKRLKKKKKMMMMMMMMMMMIQRQIMAWPWNMRQGSSNFTVIESCAVRYRPMGTGSRVLGDEFPQKLKLFAHLHIISSRMVIRCVFGHRLHIAYVIKQEVKVIWQKAPHGGPFPG